jgi:hypothetical protein
MFICVEETSQKFKLFIICIAQYQPYDFNQTGSNINLNVDNEGNKLLFLENKNI